MPELALVASKPAPPAAAIDPAKRFATCQARAALVRGLELRRVEAGTGEFILSRWDWTRTLDDLDAVEALLDCLEGGRVSGAA